MADELTGRKRYRIGWRRKLILQVEVKRTHYSDPGCCGYPEERRYTEWRDATADDIMNMPELSQV